MLKNSIVTKFCHLEIGGQVTMPHRVESIPSVQTSAENFQLLFLAVYRNSSGELEGNVPTIDGPLIGGFDNLTVMYVLQTDLELELELGLRVDYRTLGLMNPRTVDL